ncbi:hypothetical protein KSD_42960 [Ktedonobacter sp. SOSP1-85]|nr:hypothetical protein KSD_42960 [Ktedonobacter sp. SOSP1-85]
MCLMERLIQRQTMQGEIKAQRISYSPTEIFAHVTGTCGDTLMNDSQAHKEQRKRDKNGHTPVNRINKLSYKLRIQEFQSEASYQEKR